MIAASEARELFAFACQVDGDRLVFMLNLSDEPRSLERTGDVEPLVPIFSNGGSLAAVPSITITLPGDGTVIYTNPLPPRSIVVFAPIRQKHIRPHGLDE